MPKYTLQEYYHDHLDRVSAQALLLSAPGAASGHFLLRHSSRKHCKNDVLSLLYKEQVLNYEILKEVRVVIHWC